NLRKEELTKELEALRNKDSINLARQREKIDSLRGMVTGYPVTPFAEPLFSVYARQGSLSPKERADIITDRIRGLADDYFFHPDSLKIVQAEELIDISYKGKVVIGISEIDAIWMEKSKAELAAELRARIGSEVSNYQKATSWKTLIIEASLALLDRKSVVQGKSGEC